MKYCKMKYCKGKFHGNVQKEIDDSEEFCLICKGRMLAEKEEKKKKCGKIFKTYIAPAVIAAGTYFGGKIVDTIISSKTES